MTGFTIGEVSRAVRVMGAALRSLPRIEMRRIWFFEAKAYRRAGWLVRHPAGGHGFHFCPMAVRLAEITA